MREIYDYPDINISNSHLVRWLEYINTNTNSRLGDGIKKEKSHKNHKNHKSHKNHKTHKKLIKKSKKRIRKSNR